MQGLNGKFAIAILAAAATLPAVATAQQRSDALQWEATIYGYFPTIGGTTKFPPPASGGSTVDVDASKIIDSLKMTFMGTLGVQSNTWGAFTDVLYLDVGGNKSNTRDITVGGGLPAGATASGSLDLKSTLWTFAGTYRMSRDPASTVDLFAGARYAQIQQSLNWQFTGTVDTIPVANRNGYQSAKMTNWDGIIGVKGRASFGDGNRWFVPWYVDVGTGDSDLTWQGIIGLGYKYSWGDIFAVWRYIDYKMPSDKVVQDLTLNGGAIGVSFRW
jgi:hypothetical protein